MKHAQRDFTMSDQFTPSGPEAYLGTSDSHFKAIRVCWYLFYQPLEDGELSEL